MATLFEACQYKCYMGKRYTIKCFFVCVDWKFINLFSVPIPILEAKFAFSIEHILAPIPLLIIFPQNSCFFFF